MSAEEFEIATTLCDRDTEFKELWDEHQTLKTQIKDLESRRYLTPEDEIELKRIKRLKLTGKDRIAVKIREYKVTVSGPQ